MAAKLPTPLPSWCVPGATVRMQGKTAKVVKVSLADPALVFVIPEGDRAPRQVRLADLTPLTKTPPAGR